MEEEKFNSSLSKYLAFSFLYLHFFYYLIYYCKDTKLIPILVKKVTLFVTCYKVRFHASLDNRVIGLFVPVFGIPVACQFFKTNHISINSIPLFLSHALLYVMCFFYAPSCHIWLFYRYNYTYSNHCV